MGESRFQGSEVLFDSDEIRVSRSGHPEHPAGVWTLEVVGDLCTRDAVSTTDGVAAARWVEALEAGDFPEVEHVAR